ncbi:MAG: leucine-rich repeat protein [Clostridia bacterium]|nr:leucine-rich repeat protein [Clostridia bacterium]
MKTSKKLLSILLSLIMVLTVVPQAVIPASALDATGTCGGAYYGHSVSWEFDESTGALVIRYNYTGGGGYMTNYDDVITGSGKSPFATFCYHDDGSITSLTIEEGVESIGDYAFQYAKSFRSLVLPNGMKRVGDYAFFRSSLRNLTLPHTIQTIGDHAFGDGDFEYVYYEGSPDEWANVTIGSDNTAFRNIYYAYEDGDLENGVTWHFDAATGTLTISGAGAVTDVWSSMGYRFYENLYHPELVTDIVIEEGITQIDVNTFEGLENVQTVSLPSTLENIGDEAFKDCAALESVTVPEGVLWVGDNAFDGCSALRRVKLPSTLTYLGDHVFDGTDALVAVVMYPGIENTFEAGALDSYNNSNVRIYFVGTAEQLDATRVLCSDGIERPLANAAVVVQVSFPYCEVEVYLLDDTVGQAEYYDDLYQRVEFGEEFTLAPELAEHRYVKGWYQNHGELISSEATYTGTANTGFISMSCKIGCNHDWTGESYNTTRSCTQQYIYYETEPQRGDVIVIQNCAYCEAVRLRKQGFNNWTTTNKDNADYLAAMARLTIHYDPSMTAAATTALKRFPTMTITTIIAATTAARSSATPASTTTTTASATFAALSLNIPGRLFMTPRRPALAHGSTGLKTRTSPARKPAPTALPCASTTSAATRESLRLTTLQPMKKSSRLTPIWDSLCMTGILFTTPHSPANTRISIGPKTRTLPARISATPVILPASTMSAATRESLRLTTLQPTKKSLRLTRT